MSNLYVSVVSIFDLNPLKMGYKLFLIAMFLIGKNAICQPIIDIRLTLVQKQNTQGDPLDMGVLIDTKNLTNTNIALYNGAPALLYLIKIYKYDNATSKYVQVIHPNDLLLKKEMAFKDSVYKKTQTIVDFFGENEFNKPSGLYNQFAENDSLWYSHTLTRAQVARTVTEKEMSSLNQSLQVARHSEWFDFIERKEHYQEFLDVSFINLAKGDYKIVLDLPDIDIKHQVLIAKRFLLYDKKSVSSNTIYISIR